MEELLVYFCSPQNFVKIIFLKRSKNHVFGCFRAFFDRFGRFFEHGKPLGMIGDDFGRFDFRRFSSIFVDFRRVSVGFRGG